MTRSTCRWRRTSSYGHMEVENVDEEVKVKEYVEVEES